MKIRPAVLTGCVLMTLLWGCSEGSENQTRQPARQAPPAATQQLDLAGSAPLVVYLGDSLAAGLGLAEEEAFPALAEEMLRQEGLVIRTVNAGVSGDTTAGGLSRLDWLLRQSPAVVVVELGANDGLRGLEPEMTENNLRRIVQQSRAAGARVLLVGMKVPPNYGGDYAGRFEEVYPRLASELGVELMPFLLQDVAGDPMLNLGDGIHPNAAGQQRVAANIVPYLREILSGLEKDVEVD
ncbi:MAG: arylesterase [Thermoanaerobaculia bacterium]